MGVGGCFTFCSELILLCRSPRVLTPIAAHYPDIGPALLRQASQTQTQSKDSCEELILGVSYVA